MRFAMVAAVVFFGLALDARSSAQAALYKWCAYYTNGGTNCGFPTRWACQASVSGAGGLCTINPRWQAYGDEPDYAPRHRRGHKHKHRHYH